MKILSSEQIRALDKATIEQEPISSLDLMERAASVFANWLMEKNPDTETPIIVFCGTGNNGGDGLAVARMLSQKFYKVQVICCAISEQKSTDFQANYERLIDKKIVVLEQLNEGDKLPEIVENALIIDALFGSGLNRPVEQFWAALIEHINESNVPIFSIDLPSGMYADLPTTAISITATATLSFEFPKRAFMFPENFKRVGHWECKSIGLHQKSIVKSRTPNFLITEKLVQSILKPRNKFDHKGTFGHALLVLGSLGKVGAAILATKACLRAGAGLVTVHAPRIAYPILQAAVPEAMVQIDAQDNFCSKIIKFSQKNNTIGIGCGIGTEPMVAAALKYLLHDYTKPMVLDADALNLIALDHSMFELIPKGSILTPHPKEFERLFGFSENNFDRNKLQRMKSKELGVYIVLKGAHTCVTTPEGESFFNSSGNPGMACAGSGDVLTGILTALLAQNYTPKHAALVGVYLHGLAGDIAACEKGMHALIAGDIIEQLGAAYLQIQFKQ